MNGNVIRTITIRGTSEGLDKLQTDLVKLAAAHKGVAIAAEETDKKTLSLEQAWKRQTLRLDEAARAQHNIARETKLADQALREGLATQAQHAKQLELINQRYTTTATGAQTYGKALQQGTGEARLARHELINLSRQFQDVGVSLASGQAPLTVLVQQGSQIADVFATSSGTIGGFFKQVGAGAAGFLASTAGMATAAAGIGTALVVVGANYASAQREIQKGLSGIGAASGVTLDQINAIAEATWTWGGASVSQARVAATAFAATGNIFKANVEQATKIIDAHVRAGGDAEEMTKRLGAALEDPAKGALELNKQYGFLNATTLENIRLLQSQGKEQEAQALLMDKLLPKMQKQAEIVGFWGNAWNVASNAASAYFDDLGKAIARTGERATGAKFLGGFTDEERLGRARERVSGLQERVAQPRSAMQAAVPQSVLDELKAAQEEVARLEQALDKGTAAFDRLSHKAQMAADGFMPLKAQIRETQEQLSNLQKYQAAGGYVDPAVIAAGELRLQQMQQQEQSLIRQNEYTQAIAASYPGMSIEVAKQLDALQGQLTVAQARTGAEQIITQEYVTQNVTLAGIRSAEEAAAIAAGQRAVAEANVSTQIQNQIHALEDEIKMNNARVQGTEAATAAEIAYQNARRQGASEADAQQLKKTSAAAADSRNQKTALDLMNEADAELGNIGEEIQRNTGYTQQLTAATAEYVRFLRTGNEIIEGRLALMQTQFEGETYQLGGTSDASGGGIVSGGGGYELGGLNLKEFAKYFERFSPRLGDPMPLIESIDDLKDSTDSLNATMQDALSPFYSQDPRTTKLGFRAGVTGNPDWMTGAGNANPLVAVLGAGATAPGMAAGGSFVVGGGYSANDNSMAVFPVASGEEVVVNRSPQGRGGQVINIDNRIVITGSVDADALSKMKVSRYQQAQRMRAGLRG